MRQPVLAGSFSFFLPGLSLGQLYNEDYTSFGIHFGISGGIFLFLMAAKSVDLYELSIMNMSGSGNEGKREWIFTVCLLTYIGN